MLYARMRGLELQNEYVQGSPCIRMPAHENVDRRIVLLRPSVDGHVRFREQRDPGDASRRRKLMQEYFEQSGARSVGGCFQHSGQRLSICKMTGAPEIDNPMSADTSSPAHV